MPDVNQLNLFDLLFIAFTGLSVLTACWRGLGKEMLHTLLFAATLAGAYFFFQTQEISDTTSVVKMLLNFGYFAISSYFITWAVMKFVAPVFLDGRQAGIRGRFWAGGLALFKVLALALGLNLWYAVHSIDAHPMRLNPLPQVMRESVLVQLSDSTTEEIYKQLAAKGWLSYEKYTHRPATKKEEAWQENKEMLGLDKPQE